MLSKTKKVIQRELMHFNNICAHSLIQKILFLQTNTHIHTHTHIHTNTHTHTPGSCIENLIILKIIHTLTTVQ